MVGDELDARQPRTVTTILESRNKGWNLSPALIRLYSVLVPACLVICITNGYDSSLLNGLQAVPTWETDFQNPSGAILGFMSASYPLGAVISTPFSAAISDRFGRRWSIFVGSIIMVGGVAMQAAANGRTLFIVGRIVVGFGITLALSIGPVLISELVYPSHRVFFTGMYNVTFYLGSLICAWIVYATFHMSSSWAWRIPTILQALPALFQIAFIWLLPESPRWLIYKNRSQEALEILIKYHGNGDQHDELVRAEFYEIQESIRAGKEEEGNPLKLFVTSPANRRRLLILVIVAIASQWSGNGLVSYYLAKILDSIGITASREKLMINGALTCTNFATSLMAVTVASRVGRRVLFVGGGAGMWLSFSALTIGLAVYNELGREAAGKAALGFIFIYYTTFNFALNPTLYLYPSEVLPFRMRATGMSILISISKGALFFNQFVNPIGMDAVGWKYYLVYVGWLLVETTLFYFLFPETHGKTLEKIEEIFEKYNHKEGLERELDEGKEKVVEVAHKENV